MVGIIGSSGSGKTTLADLILGLLKPNNGKIIFNDKFDLKNYQFSRDFWICTTRCFFIKRLNKKQLNYGN